MKFVIDRDNVLIKTYLRNELGISAKAMIKLKPKGIFVNGKHARVVDYMHKGDVLEIIQTVDKKKEYPTEDIPLVKIYEDDNLLILNKPYGMPVYPAGEHLTGSLLSAFANEYKDLVFRPIFRLDRNTSGLVVLAKNRMSTSVCDIEKTYLAVCEGEVPLKGEINSPIGLAEGSRIKRTTGHGKEALTLYERVSFDGIHSLVSVNIITGRTHQIRVHLSSIGFPLAGDDLYGGSTELIKRHALHCYKLKIKSELLKIDTVFISTYYEDIEHTFKELFRGN